MADESLCVEDEVRDEDRAFLNEQLYRFNATAAGVNDGQWLAVLARDGEGQIRAGLHGWTWGGAGYVDTLWVREDLRGNGLGTQLLAAAEAEAARRGCREMHLTTHSFQAPGFYWRQGYGLIGELPGWPGDTTRLFFRKALGGPAATPGGPRSNA